MSRAEAAAAAQSEAEERARKAVERAETESARAVRAEDAAESMRRDVTHADRRSAELRDQVTDLRGKLATALAERDAAARDADRAKAYGDQRVDELRPPRRRGPPSAGRTRRAPGRVQHRACGCRRATQQSRPGGGPPRRRRPGKQGAAPPVVRRPWTATGRGHRVQGLKDPRVGSERRNPPRRSVLGAHDRPFGPSPCRRARHLRREDEPRWMSDGSRDQETDREARAVGEGGPAVTAARQDDHGLHHGDQGERCERHHQAAMSRVPQTQPTECR